MANTLAALFLTLSEDLSALSDERRVRLKNAEHARLSALDGLPEAQPALKQHATAVRKATTTLNKAEHTAAKAERTATRKAQRAADDARATAQRDFRDADPRAARRAAAGEAERVYKERLVEIQQTVSLGDQHRSRTDARKLFSKAKAAAQRASEKALQVSVDEHRTALRDAARTESTALRHVREDADRARSDAESDCKRALHQADLELTATLAAIPGAVAIERMFGDQNRLIKRETRQGEEALRDGSAGQTGQDNKQQRRRRRPGGHAHDGSPRCHVFSASLNYTITGRGPHLP